MLGEKPGPDAFAAPKGEDHPQRLCVPQSRLWGYGSHPRSSCCFQKMQSTPLPLLREDALPSIFILNYGLTAPLLLASPHFCSVFPPSVRVL